MLLEERRLSYVSCLSNAAYLALAFIPSRRLFSHRCRSAQLLATYSLHAPPASALARTSVSTMSILYGITVGL
jgi:hypothetical protein